MPRGINRFVHFAYVINYLLYLLLSPQVPLLQFQNHSRHPQNRRFNPIPIFQYHPIHVISNFIENPLFPVDLPNQAFAAPAIHTGCKFEPALSNGAKTSNTHFSTQSSCHRPTNLALGSESRKVDFHFFRKVLENQGSPLENPILPPKLTGFLNYGDFLWPRQTHHKRHLQYTRPTGAKTRPPKLRPQLVILPLQIHTSLLLPLELLRPPQSHLPVPLHPPNSQPTITATTKHP